MARVLYDLVVGGGSIAGCLLGAPLLRGWYNRWGSSEAERTETLPGDELVPKPKLGYTRALTIDAPPEDVWPWLVQLGQGRGGFYSHDTLENVAGCQIHSADRILSEHQQLVPGQRIQGDPGPRVSWEVIDVNPPHHLVLMGADPATGRAPPVREPVPAHGYAASTWQWVLRPRASHTTRLIVRQRLTYSPDQRVLWHLVEPFNFVMEREMLRGIARRAERSSYVGSAFTGPDVDAA